MSNFSIYDGLFAYAKRANSGLYLESRTAIFNNPADQIYTPKGKVTMIRQYESGKAGNYNKKSGWMGNYGNGKGVQWIEYKAPYDRAKILSVDAIDEMQSYENGMVPSIELLNADFLDNQMPSEIDATNIAQFCSQVPEANKYKSTDPAYATDEDSILNTVLQLQNNVFNSGYNRETVLFMRASVYTAFQKAIIKNYGMASGVMLTKSMDVQIKTGLENLITDSNDSISVTVDIEVFGNFYIIKMPDDRMYTKISLLDGYSVGQEEGGYIPDTSADDFALVDMLAIPLNSAFTNTRYMVDNFLVPSNLPGISYNNVELRQLNQQMYGNVEIGNAGINQKANAFEYDIRLIYGGSIFDNRRRNCFAVIKDESNVKVSSLTVGTDNGLSAITTKGGTLQMTSNVIPVLAKDKEVTWSVETLSTGVATISATGLLTATTNGTVTVKATAKDGSNVVGSKVITISNQA